MIKNLLLTTALFASIGAAAQAPAYSTRAQQYILKYKDLAVAEQRRSGIPAAITLGQGILETDAGNSELATLANNHFGIKCKKEWTGETFNHDDDAPQECFRKYPTAIQSYKDHSDYLKSSKRYQSCFLIDQTDYASWATELRKCGYATNPKYARILIRIIEDYHLQDFTYAALGAKPGPVLIASAGSPAAATMMAEHVAEVVPEHDSPSPTGDTPVYGQAVKKDGLRGFYARKGDVLLEYAIQYKVRYAKLLEINNLPDAPLASDMFVLLEKGSLISQMISRDASAPAEASAPAPGRDAVYRFKTADPAPAASGQQSLQATEPAPASSSAAAPAAAPEVLASVAAVPAAKDHTEAVRSNTVLLSEPAPAVPELASLAQPQAGLQAIPQSEPVPDPVQVETPVLAAVTASEEKPVNIADEPAVGEEDAEEGDDEEGPAKPAANPEPHDEFTRLKARLDKVVYAPATSAAPKRTAAPVPATTPATSPATAAPSTVRQAAPALAAAAPGGKVFHTVKSGETAFGIARQYGISIKELNALNNLNFEAIRIGQKLRVK